MSKMTMSLNDHLEEMLGDIELLDYPEYNSPFRIAVISRRPPRHEYFDYIRDIGKQDIDNVFNHDRITVDNNGVTFVFPERHMSQAEQQMFVPWLNEHPQVKKGDVKKIDIITASPLIIGNFRREQVRAISFTDDRTNDELKRT